jgi:hypothetical protein
MSARRQAALNRIELREPSEARTAAIGATSFPVKKRDNATAAVIAEFLAKNSGDGR